jgi:cysteine desulfurase
MLRRVYLDNSSTTPVDPRVVEAMLPFLTDKFGNASSIHLFGQESRAAVDKARHQTASLIKARPNEVVFTSGGTESNNLAIRGLLEANSKYGNHIVTSAIEHPSVKGLCEDLEKHGYSVTYLPVYGDGIVRLDDIRNAIIDKTILVSVMTANNEIGTIQPVAEIGKLLGEIRSSGKKIWLHTDAVQAAGKIPIDVEEMRCDLLSISGHKIHAPKGVGALFIRRGVRLHSQNIGGHQERERRGGTESVANIVAFGKACELAMAGLRDNAEYLRELRDKFENEVGEKISNLVFNGDRANRLPNLANISFLDVEGEALLINLDMQGIAVSTGSACSSGSLEPSPVIRALGGNEDTARGAVRFSFGRMNTIEDVDHTLEILPKAVDTLRKLSPGYNRKASQKT